MSQWALSGYLERWAPERQAWLSRWFAIDSGQSALLWFKTSQEGKSAPLPKGRYGVTQNTLVTPPEESSSCCFCLCGGSGYPRVILRAASRNSLLSWMKALQTLCNEAPLQTLKPIFSAPNNDNFSQQEWDSFEEALSQGTFTPKFRKMARKGCPHEMRPSYWLMLAPYVFDSEGKHRKKKRATEQKSLVEQLQQQASPASSALTENECKTRKKRGSTTLSIPNLFSSFSFASTPTATSPSNPATPTTTIHTSVPATPTSTDIPATLTSPASFINTSVSTSTLSADISAPVAPITTTLTTTSTTAPPPPSATSVTAPTTTTTPAAVSNSPALTTPVSFLPSLSATSASFASFLSVSPRKRAATLKAPNNDVIRVHFAEIVASYLDLMPYVPPFDITSDNSDDEDDTQNEALPASTSASSPTSPFSTALSFAWPLAPLLSALSPTAETSPAPPPLFSCIPRVSSSLTLSSSYRLPYPDTIKIVNSDISRTYSNLPYFRAFEGQMALRRVLLAFAVRNPSIGYCQSLNFIAGVLLLLYPESTAFGFLQLITCEILPADYFTSTMIGVQTDVRVFLDLLQKKQPRVIAHCAKLGVDISVVAVSWFLCLFTKTLPLETCLIIWDNLLMEGDKVLFRVGLALISMHARHILKIQDVGEMFGYLNSMGSDCHNADRLLHAAFYEQGTLRRADIEAARVVRRQELQTELNNRNATKLISLIRLSDEIATPG